MRKENLTAAAVAGGGLLAAMVFINGVLSNYTNPVFSSFVVHLAGLIGSLILWFIFSGRIRRSLVSADAPLWAYSGGIGGAFAVVLANIAVNSRLGLAGSLSCFIIGQTVTSIIFDYLGFFQEVKRKIQLNDIIRMAAILSGALLLINAGGHR